MAIPESFLDELVSRSDITDIVSDYVSLTKRSGANVYGLCPFHSEKTPSFSVNHERQMYHCFGCGKGGNVINFIMEIENLPFIDAVGFLAKRAGMTVPDDSSSSEVKSKRAKILELNREAARFFHSILFTPQGDAAVKYLAKRGISKTMVTKFGLGAAPDSWSALKDTMLKKGFSERDLLDAGLAKTSRNNSKSIYDAFRNRLIFPVIDVRGSVIGFSGRILDGGEPKYLNSPDTAVFNKSKNLFALNLAKKTKSGMLILVEGNIDVVSLHQAGIDCAVASLGTALTSEQVQLMSRYTENIVLAYDSDSAGVKASQRAIGLLEKTGLNIKVLKIPGAKDPDEFIKKNGADAFLNLLEKGENQIEYRLESIKSKYDITSDNGRIGFLNEATQMLSRLDSAVQREIYGTKVADIIGVSNQAVQNEIKKAFMRKTSKDIKKGENDDLKILKNMQPAAKEIRYADVISAAAEEGVIRLLILDPQLIEHTSGLTESEFTSPFLGKTFSMIKKRYNEGLEISVRTIMTGLVPEEAAQLSVLMQKHEVMSKSTDAMNDYIEKIRTEKLVKSASDEDKLRAMNEMFREKKGYG